MKNCIIQKLFKPKYPVVRQYDKVDCGPAALLSILKYYNGNASLVYIRELCKAKTNGTTMSDLISASKSIGLDAYSATGEYEELMKEHLPCIAHVTDKHELNHFIVIYKVSLKGLLVGDPAKGKYKITRDNFLKIWKHKAVILFKPTKAPINVPTINCWSWIFRYISRHESLIYQSIFLGILYASLSVLTAIFVQWLIDRFIPEQDKVKIFATGIALFVISILRSLSGYFRQKILILLNKYITIDINSDFVSHMFQLPKSFFNTRKIGDITARINDNIWIQRLVLLIFNSSIIDALSIMVALIIMMYLSKKMALVMLAALPVYVLMLLTQKSKIREKQSEVMKNFALVESSYIDSLKGIDVIIGFNASNYFSRLNNDLFSRFQMKVESLGLTRAFLTFLAEIANTITTVYLLSFGALLIIDGNLSLGQMIASYSLLTNILPKINSLFEASIALQGANIAIQRLRDILLVDKEKKVGTRNFTSTIFKVNNGYYSWSNNNKLFQGLNLSLKRGELASLWGRSGTGKTTLVQILQRKYQLTNGQILIDEIPADLLNLEEYRKRVAVIPQEIKVFNKTIIENIALGRRACHQDDVIDQFRVYGLDNFISKFKNGLFTMLGEDSRKLSGGELQMLALFRAIYDSPGLLIIDEGFSGLDIETEQIIFESIKQYSQNHAVLLVTHNTRIILKTDFLYILGNGVIAERGRPQDLINKYDGQFNKLIKQSSY